MSFKFTVEEKHQLVANLDIEVNHRKTQFSSWLNDHLENFAIHQEGLVSRIPKQVRAMKMRDFGAKYNGNIQAALRGVQRDKFVAGATEIDKSTRKRKWVASQEAEHDASADSQKASKNARMTVSLQKKPGSSTGPGTAQRARILAAAGTKSSTMSRTFGSPSPHKLRAPFNTATQSPRPLPRAPISPSKLKPSTNAPTRARVPSIVTFNPMVPKTPGYPGGSLRLPRKDESMLSVNGSPIANPYDVWPEETKSGTGQTRTLKRTKSSITIQRDPSFSLANTEGGSSSSSRIHSRTTSQASSQTHQPSSSLSSLNGNTTVQPQPQPLAHPHMHAHTKSATQFHQFRFPQPQQYSSSQPTEPTPATPAAPRPLAHTRSQSTLPITLSTRDGYVLAFDALQTSPGELDALEGISDSAKKQAREEMRMLVRAAVDKWTI
ncbi:hypothetical protein FB451DRAFT_1341614 [Mycena latifolia]|nr:hypothetical protein FB451DRAFT_1341614 [Mycena latifolia]